LAQGIISEDPPEDARDITCHPHHIQGLSDKLYDVSDSFQHSRYGTIKRAATDEQRHLLVIQERIRLHTHALRNWDYFQLVLNVLRKLFTPLDPRCVGITGIRSCDDITLFSKILEEIERGMNASRAAGIAAPIWCYGPKETFQDLGCVRCWMNSNMLAAGKCRG
jgi:hypothetical protein